MFKSLWVGEGVAHFRWTLMMFFEVIKVRAYYFSTQDNQLV